jgi:hypothetical protein
MKSYDRVSHFQVARGSLYLIIDETMCSDSKDAHTTDLKTFIHGFSIARLRADGTIDGGLVIPIDGKDCTSAAKEIGNALWDVFNGSRENRALPVSGIQIQPLDWTSAFIRGANNISIEISIKGEIPDLSGYLVIISGIPYRPPGPCP